MVFSQYIDDSYKTGKIDQNIDLRLFGSDKANMIDKSMMLFDEETKTTSQSTQSTRDKYFKIFSSNIVRNSKCEHKVSELDTIQETETN